MWKWFPKLSYFYIYTIKEYLSWKTFHYNGNPEREMGRGGGGSLSAPSFPLSSNRGKASVL